LFRETAGAATGGAMAEELTPGQRRADALGVLAESALAADLDGGRAGDRYQVVLHVNAELPTAHPEPTAPSAVEEEPFDGAVEVDHGAMYVSMETSRRISCDASIVSMRHDANGSALDVGRKMRTIPPAIRRAVTARDGGCRFPGCTSRRCDAHHIEHWADGGSTSLDNLVLLCRRHHRAVHEGGFGIVRTPDGAVAFTRPDGRPLLAAPPLPDLPAEQLDPAAVASESIPVWDGTRFDVVWAIDVLYHPRSALDETGACP
jgi:hypothetical protein